MYCSISECNNVDIMAGILLIYSWFKWCYAPVYNMDSNVYTNYTLITNLMH